MKNSRKIPEEKVRNIPEMEETYDLTILDKNNALWKNSPQLQAIYATFFQRMKSLATGEDILEIGSGIAEIKEFWPEVITSDLKNTGFCDRVIDAYHIKESGTWDHIIALDVLHHLTHPFQFFESAAQALNSSGSIIMTEPAGTPLGRRLYNAVHPEPCSPEEIIEPYEFNLDENGEFANMGMGQALFSISIKNTRKKLEEVGLSIDSIEYHDVIGYFLTGGFSKKSPIPIALIIALQNAENKMPQSILKKIATRMTIVLKKL